jgi:hypothetical protein
MTQNLSTSLGAFKLLSFRCALFSYLERKRSYIDRVDERSRFDIDPRREHVFKLFGTLVRTSSLSSLIPGRFAAN